MSSGILFDFDDTLVETTVHFNRAKDRFAARMNALGFPGEEALEVLNVFDIRNVRRYGGFFKQCFPLALGETYEFYCRSNGRKCAPQQKKEMEDLGWWVFEQPVQPVEGAMEVLQRLCGVLPLFLATKGDPLVQHGRIEESGLLRYFKEIYVLVDKNSTAYRDIALEQRLKPAVSWVVGNSMKSDINPALVAGFKCIYIQHPYTWDFEDEAPLGGHISVDSLAVVPKVVGL
ncbi:MAG: hypothetical protein BWY80_00018 [Firmicutes bacterium ADurb.Bin456]|nr:MAG: hypothetical protein BWY80_00018 [Firmicutes bacterium ADurb.Bin456]